MTTPLCSFPEGERRKVAERRVSAKTGGLGYLAALDFFLPRKEGKPPVKKEAVKEKAAES